MTIDSDRLIKEIGNPDCKHSLEDGSSAYEWRVYGIEYIKTCSICCDLDYSSRTLYMPQLSESISTAAMIDKLAGCITTVNTLKGPRYIPAHDPVIEDLTREIRDLQSALLSRGVDIVKYIKTGEEVICE